jgi:putative nucleotidyltransferase with HDIG domain
MVEPAPYSDAIGLPSRQAALASAPAEPASLLLVDGDAAGRAAFTQILEQQGYDVTCAESAAEAEARIAQRPFDLLLCDFSLPEKLRTKLLCDAIHQHPDMAVVLVGERGAGDLAQAAIALGASDYITRPCTQGELSILVQRNLTRRSLQRKHSQRFRLALETSYESVLDALLTALNTRDTEPQGHCERVTAYTMEIGDRMGLPASLTYHIERGALLHDIGKVGIPDHILHKPESLTAAEWTEMKKHPVIGYQMCAKVDMLHPASLIVRHHHEKWDGTGYPDGLRGEAIHLGARVFAVADALDALTSDRPYRRAGPFGAAREEIAKGAGKQFDPRIVREFLGIPEERWAHIRANAAR